MASNEISQMLLKAKASTAYTKTAKGKLSEYIVTCLTEIKNCANLYSFVRGEMKGNQQLLEKLKLKFDRMEELFVKETLADGVRTNEFAFADQEELVTAAKVTVGLIQAIGAYLFVENFDSKQVDFAAKLITSGM